VEKPDLSERIGKLVEALSHSHKKALGYKPQIKFEDRLEETHRWFVENWENIEKSAEFS
jgi:dTDP-D-glucose 4,6-dehydratase